MRPRSRRRGAGLSVWHGGDCGAVPHAEARRERSPCSGRSTTARLPGSRSSARIARSRSTISRGPIRPASSGRCRLRSRRSFGSRRPPTRCWMWSTSPRAAEVAHAAGALLAVDSTAATPILTRPLALGADLVMHSATKYLNGHSDVVAGVLVTRQKDDRWAAIRADRHDAGALLGPFEAWLLLRGLRTLALRVRQASANALALARFLEDHSKVERVLYPGLPSHPRHALAIRQMEGGCGGLLSFQVAGRCGSRARRRRAPPADRTRDLARRHRKRDRASLHDRRPRDRRAAQPAPPRGRHRGQGRPDRRSRAGARRRWNVGSHTLDGFRDCEPGTPLVQRRRIVCISS